MAFNATVNALDTVLTRIRRQAADSKTYLQSQRAAMVQPVVSSLVPLAVIQHFAVVIPFFDALAATPGIAQYAKDQLSDQTYDIVAEYTTMRNAMVSARDSLMNLCPKDVNGFLLLNKFSADGTVNPRNFTDVQLQPAVAQVDSVIATIN